MGRGALHHNSIAFPILFLFMLRFLLLRPIAVIMALIACLRLLPFMVGGQNEVFWFALAAGATGGLLSSLFVVFLFLPIVLTRREYVENTF